MHSHGNLSTVFKKCSFWLIKLSCIKIIKNSLHFHTKISGNSFYFYVKRTPPFGVFYESHERMWISRQSQFTVNPFWPFSSIPLYYPHLPQYFSSFISMICDFPFEIYSITKRCLNKIHWQSFVCISKICIHCLKILAKTWTVLGSWYNRILPLWRTSRKLC